jgi:cytoskeletal protein RodZ
MSEFGEELRRERESRGIALELITDSTKIGSRYLAALESGHFSHLPGGVLNRGIVRSYARVVGLDEDTWVERFMSAYRESGQLLDDDASWIAFAQNVGKSRVHEIDRPKMRLRWAGVAVLVVVLAALGWFVWYFASSKTPTQARAEFQAPALSVSQSGHRLPEV